MKDQAADQVVVTGDLTQLALPGECDAARRCLEAIGPPRNVFMIPGNHDALVVGRVGERRCPAGPDYLASDEPRAPGRTEWPALRVRGPDRPDRAVQRASDPPVLGRRPHRRGPARPLFRAGWTLPARRSLYRVLLIHHPPVPGHAVRAQAPGGCRRAGRDGSAARRRAHPARTHPPALP
ncbi:MAG: hypothetical protein MZV70_67220 [Desulfobacterales bacterium]|nr:hypothetical protein [Desulfobacterales bacterium]